MLEPMTEKDKELTIKNIVNALKDISRLNKRGYKYLHSCFGFIAHYNIDGFKYYYTENSLYDDMKRNLKMNQWNNFSKGEKYYDYMVQQKEIYNESLKRFDN